MRIQVNEISTETKTSPQGLLKEGNMETKRRTFYFFFLVNFELSGENEGLKVEIDS